MNRIIFAATALVGLALVANNGSFEPTGRCVKDLSLKAKTGRDFPSRKVPQAQERLFAVEVRDEALEELRRHSRVANKGRATPRW